MEKIDDHTVSFKFGKPEGLFLVIMATPSGMAPTRHPAHYLKQFLPKYNKNVEAMAKKNGYKTWQDQFNDKNALYGSGNPDKPELFAWNVKIPYGANTSRAEAERNPYYWKVDSEGNQLPYLDKVVLNIVENDQAALLKMLNGELDMYSGSVKDKPVLYKNRKKGNFHFIDVAMTQMNNTVIALALAHKDPIKRKVFNDKNFRIGLSYALNRQEILDVVYVSQGEPWQTAPRPESKYFDKEMAKQYTEHDPDKANQYLDKVLPKKGSDGMRLGPDGKTFSFLIEINEEPTWIDAMDLVKKYWRSVGIDVNVKSESTELFGTRKDGNEVDASVWSGDGGLDMMVEPRWYFPYSTWSLFAVPWANWYNAGGLTGKIDKDAVTGPIVEPPDIAKKQMQLYEQIKRTADPKKQSDLMTQIIQIAKDQFWAMGINLPVPLYEAVKNDFRNVPNKALYAYQYPTPGPWNPQQFFHE